MRADGLLAALDRVGRFALPGTVLLFFVVLTLAPLRLLPVSVTVVPPPTGPLLGETEDSAGAAT